MSPNIWHPKVSFVSGTKQRMDIHEQEIPNKAAGSSKPLKGGGRIVKASSGASFGRQLQKSMHFSHILF